MQRGDDRCGLSPPLGVTSVRDRLTRDDVLEGNVDPLNRGGELLAALPVRRLDVTVTPAGSDDLDIEVEADNVDRVDVTGVPGATSVKVKGFAGGELVAALGLDIG